MGYDGKGQTRIYTPADIAPAWQANADKPLILESFVEFSIEVSLLAVRNQAGEIRYYPLTENYHKDGILRISNAPYQDHELQHKLKPMPKPSCNT